MKSIFAIGLALLGSLGAQAQTLPLKTLTGSELGLVISNYTYQEDYNGSFVMSLEGRKTGVSGAFTQALPENWYWGMDGRFVTGNVDYKSASTGDKSANSDSYLEARATLGRDFEFGSQLISPYAGLGYRYLNNDLRGFTTTGNIGYRRTSSYIYLPIGLTHRLRLGEAARLATTLEYDYLIQGVQRSYLTDAVGGALTYTSDLSNLQRNGHGLRLNLAYETLNWSAGVFYNYWNIATSDIGVYTSTSLVHTGLEPHNITREIGVQLKYHFR